MGVLQVTTEQAGRIAGAIRKIERLAEPLRLDKPKGARGGGSSAPPSVLGRIIYYDWDANHVLVAPIRSTSDPRLRQTWGLLWTDHFVTDPPESILFAFTAIGSMPLIGSQCIVSRLGNAAMPIADILYNLGADPQDPDFMAAEPCESIRAAADPTMIHVIEQYAQCLSCDDPDPLERGGCVVTVTDADGWVVPESPYGGACILPDLSCAVMRESQCLAQGGTYVGDGAQCPVPPPPPPPTGRRPGGIIRPGDIQPIE